jgi:ankyrin repeat protein
MYPNPQDVLALPPRPSIEQYKKRAKDLVRACKSGRADAMRGWAASWIEDLIATQRETERLPQSHVAGLVDTLTKFAHVRLTGSCALADAQFVLARAHGFLSWPKFVTHLESLARATTPVSIFETAAEAVVDGNTALLERLLRENPGLISARSTREHRATLLHYVAANGVENYRQKTPKNAPAVAALLLKMGAEVDAEADVYGGGCTTLGLIATSAHPHTAGVQQGLIDVLLEHGARMDYPGRTGNRHDLIRDCLANGRPEAADYLISRGAPLDFAGAAGAGRLDAVKGFYESGHSRPNVTRSELEDGFALASAYGRTDVVEFILQAGLPVDTELKQHGDGHTSLHVASFHAHADLVKALLKRGARVDIKDKTWGTPPLMWALSGWSLKPAAPPERVYETVRLLVAAGSMVKPEWLDSEPIRSDPRMVEALTGRR